MRVCFLWICFSIVVCISGCSHVDVTGASLDRSFRRLVPADTRVLVGLKIERLIKTPFYQRHRHQLDIPLLNESSAKMGLDPRRDLSDAVIAWNGKQPLVLARGTFNSNLVQQKLISSGAQSRKYKNYSLIGTEREAAVFLKGPVVVAGSTPALHAALDGDDNGRSELPEELQERLSSLPKDDQIWLVSRGGLPFTELPMNSELGSALSNIIQFVQGSSVGISVDNGLRLKAEITCVSDQGAQRVRDALKGGIGLARLTTKDNELDLLRLWDAFQIDQQGSSVHVSADIAGDLADKMLLRLPQLTGRANNALKMQ